MSRVFDRGLNKSMHSIVPLDIREAEGVRQGLNKSMHCIVPCESWRVEGFRQGSDLKYALFCTTRE